MGWEANKEDFLKMMQVSHEIFGDEILEIEGASEKYLLEYFEGKLSGLLDWTITCNSKYFNTRASGFGGIESIKLNGEGFGLDMKRCIEIFDYIHGRVRWNKTFESCGLNWADSIIVLNYIEHGWPLFEGAYTLKPNSNRLDAGGLLI